MDYSLLLQHLAKHIQLSPEQEKLLLSRLQSKKLRRRQFLLQEGDVTRAAIFVTEGLLRMYSIDKNGGEHVLQFAPPGWWIGDMKSFNSQQPGTLYVDTLEDSEILLIEKPRLQQLYEELPALDRYNNFCQTYPSLIGNLPQKQVASYIGVTPEFLSKMLSQKQSPS